MNYRLHPDAETELGDAAAYYAARASRAIATAFLVEFTRVADLISVNPELGTPVDGGLRIHPFRRFPYSLIDCEDERGPAILAVAHQHREPGYWRTRP